MVVIITGNHTHQESEIMFLVGFFCFVVGIGVGALLFMQLSPEQKKAREITKHLHEQQDELRNYQQGVMSHYVETSRLLNQLYNSYSELHNQLATAADDLCAQNAVTPIIQPMNNQEYSYTNSNNSDAVMPPLDYAPKTTPYDRGTLDEEYGLEKVHVSEK